MKDVHVLEFSCQSPLKFYEHCSTCARFGDDCPDLQLGLEILRRKQKLVYEQVPPGEGVQATSFKCLAPLGLLREESSQLRPRGALPGRRIVAGAFDREKKN